MPSATSNGQTNVHVNGTTNGASNGSMEHALDLTVLGLNSGTSMVRYVLHTM